MHHIFVVMGKSSVGKDSVCVRLLADKSLNIRKLVTYTTRPPRVGEKNGREYYFVSRKTFSELIEMGSVIDIHEYNTVNGIWHYFTVDDGQVDLNDHDSLVIGTPEIVRSLRNHFKDDPDCVVPIYITVDDGERLIRAVRRESGQVNPIYSEVCRRYMADEKDFSEDVLSDIGVSKIFENVDKDVCTKEIRDYILSFQD